MREIRSSGSAEGVMGNCDPSSDSPGPMVVKQPKFTRVEEPTLLCNQTRHYEDDDQLWHYLFGIANGKLVESGLFMDPYAAGRKQQGNITFIYKDGLNSH